MPRRADGTELQRPIAAVPAGQGALTHAQPRGSAAGRDTATSATAEWTRLGAAAEGDWQASGEGDRGGEVEVDGCWLADGDDDQRVEADASSAETSTSSFLNCLSSMLLARWPSCRDEEKLSLRQCGAAGLVRLLLTALLLRPVLFLCSVGSM